MSFTSDFTMTDSNGVIVNPGGTICSITTGSSLKVDAKVNAKWAVSYLDIVTAYPQCTEPAPAYCPAMIDAGGIATNKGITWISPSVFDQHDSFGDTSGGFVNDYSVQDSQDRYAALGPYSNEPVVYSVTPTENFQNKEAGVNVLCKGRLVLMDGSYEIASADMPATKLSATVTAIGTHQISTALKDVSCFGIVVKHPLDTDPYPRYFNMLYFTHNNPSPNGASGKDAAAVHTTTINIESPGGYCAMHPTKIDVPTSVAVEGTTLVHVSIHNDGDLIAVTSVQSSDPTFTVEPFPEDMCSALGIPSSLCPASNGFNSLVPAQADTDLYVIVVSNGGGSGGTTLTFNANTGGNDCGGPNSCSANANFSSTVAVNCAITPPSASIPQSESKRFDVQCKNLGGNVISCKGDNWYWADGLSGGFQEKDNTHALAYPTSVPNSKGTLRYSSDYSKCLSDITVTESGYQCELLPSSAELNFSAKQHFRLNCFKNNTQTTPDSAAYDLQTGLGGSLGGASAIGVDYTAPNYVTSGDLTATAAFPGTNVITTAHINVIPCVGPDCPCVGPDCPCIGGDPICTVVYCAIQPSSVSLPQSEQRQFFVECQNSSHETIPCDGANWYWVGLQGDFVNKDNTQALAYTTSSPSSKGSLYYSSDKALCSSDISVTEPRFRCSLQPSSAQLTFSEKKGFSLACFENDIPRTPDSAIYNLETGFGGSLSSDSVAGVDYTAPNYNTSGNLFATAAFPGANVATNADITVSCSGPDCPPCVGPDCPCVGPDCCVGPNCPCVGPGCGPCTGSDCPPGATDYCKIDGNEQLNVAKGDIKWVSIWCGKSHDVPCKSVIWDIIPPPPEAATVDGTVTGAKITVTGEPGSSGRIIAIVDGTGKGCYKDFSILKRECWQSS